MAKLTNGPPKSTGCQGCLSGIANCFPTTRKERKRLGKLYYERPELVETVEVTTSGGKVRGGRITQTAPLQFMGIPYGEIKARFEKPTPVTPWNQVRNCLMPGPACPQGIIGLRWRSELFYAVLADVICSPLKPDNCYAYGRLSETECLNVNVWTRSLEGRKPVMVWIHGGVFMMGSNIEGGAYDGVRLVEKEDIVVVSINYRLGPFGFLHFPEEGITNLGIRDQIAALEWVRDNVSNFGGDPDNVTIAGESAGGMSCGTLLGSPKARGLFKRAVLMSGACFFAYEKSEWMQVRKVMEEGWKKKLNGKPLTSSSLMKYSASELCKMSASFTFKSPSRALGSNAMAAQPIRDADVVPATGAHSTVDGSVDCLVGYMNNEFEMFKPFTPQPKSRDKALKDVVVPWLRAHFHRTTADDKSGDEEVWHNSADKVLTLFEKFPIKGSHTALDAFRNWTVFEYPAMCAVHDFENSYGYACYGHNDNAEHLADVSLLFNHPYEHVLQYQKDVKKDSYDKAQENFIQAVVSFMRTGVPAVPNLNCKWTASGIMEMHATYGEMASLSENGLFVAFQSLEREMIDKLRITAPLPHVKGSSSLQLDHWPSQA